MSLLIFLSLSLSQLLLPAQSQDLGLFDPSAIIEFISTADNISGYVDAIRDYADNQEPGDMQTRIYQDTGLRLYMAGELEDAISFLRKADTDSRLLAAHAALLIGNHSLSISILQKLIQSVDAPAQRQQAITILGLSRISEGQELAAVSIFEPYRMHPEQILVPELLYILIRYELSLHQERRKDPGEYYKILLERFPDHPVTSLSRNFLRDGSGSGQRIVIMPSPEIFLFSSPYTVEDVPSTTKAGTVADADEMKSESESESTQPSGIQIGSFGLKENAEHMAKEMKSKGFPIIVYEQQRSDRLYYSVIVPLSAEYHSQLNESFNSVDPERIYLEIRSAGYDGFRIY